MFKLKSAVVKNVMIIMLFFAILISIYTGSKAGAFYSQNSGVQKVDTLNVEMLQQNVEKKKAKDLAKLLRHV